MTVDESTIEKVFSQVSARERYFVDKLKTAVSIASVSGDVVHRPEVFRMGEWIRSELTRLDVHNEERAPGTQVLEGQTIDLPPVILGQYPKVHDPTKKTVLVYGHYDVQPALREDGWDSDPFTLVERDGKLFGRGSTDDKGPLLAWLWIIEVYRELNLPMPVNLLMCFEGMEESGSEGLDAVIHHEATRFFQKADYVCISDNYWLGTSKPCVTYGLRGVSYYNLSVKGPGKDLHSGVFGGTVHEPMTDLVKLMASLVEPNGKILIPGIYEQVAPLTDEEKERYESIEFSLGDIHSATESTNTIHADSKEALMARWRYPTLSLHGIEGAFSAPGAKTVIPAKVIGKFSIRTVPNMEPAKVTELVKSHIATEFAKLKSKNSYQVSCGHDGRSWLADVNNGNYQAAIKATERVYKVTPDLTREGGSIPVTLTFQEALKKSVLLLPMGCADDGAHSINEKLNLSNYVNGIKLLAAYLNEIAAL